MDNSDDVGVALVDEEEDLLEYDNSMSSSGEQEGSDREEAGNGNANGSEDKVHVVSDNEIRQAAEQLLQHKLPQVFIEYNGHGFLLFDCEEKDQLQFNLPVICEDTKGFVHGCNELFNLIRRFLEDYHGKLSFVSKELILELPCLDLTLCEDNVYNSQITFSDITTIFDILRQRSLENLETDVPECIRGTVSTRPRFVSRYNTLVELTQSSATLKNIKPFQNDETHPLVLDDNGLPSTHGQTKEVVVMNLEEDEDNADREMDDKQDRSDSEELLEIVDNEEEG
ncbi:hypothetical protein ZYGR_0P04040 [Zygosaccharomyces rouxii]|uniref:ZYRO0E09790p n=2 Tax=Zygosaccharomyces rouxii TaxID=4956 RepID=C5E4Y7_ZYGRC|nr:uncharacterized protein ZYRO0E09790g [Zygosaccharomyces rouxii]KAH9198047.1 hypothetical protein LQ764DRAFT_236011 [Zygosaccharomyces rouxii]GAV49758.1 hypothetical protein ZYGR_0P04040 [Zygosaccharomyces rouxii]CAR31098.1 ZYRO0E09790p [Zygosaccharomyces rouxii]